MKGSALEKSLMLSLLGGVATLACNSLVGLDDLSVSSSRAGALSTSGAGADGTGATSNGGASSGASANEPEAGAGGDGVVIVGQCSTNQQCTDKATQDATQTGAGGEPNIDGVVPAVC